MNLVEPWSCGTVVGMGWCVCGEELMVLCKQTTMQYCTDWGGGGGGGGQDGM